MFTGQILANFKTSSEAGNKQLAILIDPNDSNIGHLDHIIDLANEQGVDYFFVGGSLVFKDRLDHCLKIIKSGSTIPSVIFPGNSLQVSRLADAVLFLSLISGRNPEYLIGQHVVAAPAIKEAGLEVIPTGYMLINGGNLSSVQYISHTLPIPSDKDEIAVSTALAGQMLGLSTLYLDAGSGARQPVPAQMISSVKSHISIPLIVGGGLSTAEKVFTTARAGADIVVIGNSLEKDPSLLLEMSHALKEAKISI